MRGYPLLPDFGHGRENSADGGVCTCIQWQRYPTTLLQGVNAVQVENFRRWVFKNIKRSPSFIIPTSQSYIAQPHTGADAAIIKDVFRRFGERQSFPNLHVRRLYDRPETATRRICQATRRHRRRCGTDGPGTDAARSQRAEHQDNGTIR